MNIALLNASPKRIDSTSGVLLEEIEPMLKGRNRTKLVSILDFSPFTMAGYDVLVVSSPIYFDGLPSELIRCLTQLEAYFHANPNPTYLVYGIANGDAPESDRTRYALWSLQHFCNAAGVQWAGGLGIGGGGLLRALAEKGWEHKWKAPVYDALSEFAEDIAARRLLKDHHYVELALPRKKYLKKLTADAKMLAKEHGYRLKDLDVEE